MRWPAGEERIGSTCMCERTEGVEGVALVTHFNRKERFARMAGPHKHGSCWASSLGKLLDAGKVTR